MHLYHIGFHVSCSTVKLDVNAAKIINNIVVVISFFDWISLPGTVLFFLCQNYVVPINTMPVFHS